MPFWLHLCASEPLSAYKHAHQLLRGIFHGGVPDGDTACVMHIETPTCSLPRKTM